MVESLVNDIAYEHAERVLEADELLREIASAARQPSYQEFIFFSRELGWDEPKVREQLRRIVNVLRFQSIAGTTADREASATEATTAASVLKKEGPKIAAEIEKLQAKLNGFERDARLSQKRVDEQNEAVAKLQELAPVHIVDRFNEQKKLLKNTLGKQINEIQVCVNEIECCLDETRYRNQNDYFDVVRRVHPEAVTVNTEGQMIRKQLSDKWPSIRASMENELAELSSKLGPMQEQFDNEMSTLNKSLSYYAR